MSTHTQRVEKVETSRTNAAERQEQVVENVRVTRSRGVYRLTQLIWLVFGVLNGLIGLRVLLKLLAANPNTPFASAVYSFTDLFLWPFAGLTITPSAAGIVLEVSSIIAILVYSLASWALVRLVWVVFGNTSSSRTSVYERHEG